MNKYKAGDIVELCCHCHEHEIVLIKRRLRDGYYAVFEDKDFIDPGIISFDTGFIRFEDVFCKIGKI